MPEPVRTAIGEAVRGYYDGCGSGAVEAATAALPHDPRLMDLQRMAELHARVETITAELAAIMAELEAFIDAAVTRGGRQIFLIAPGPRVSHARDCNGSE